jgi:adenosylmethionine-8-amino-7-oxononanoate aminotransferase
MDAMETLKETMRRAGHGEGRIAKAIEEQTSKLPSDTFLWLAGGSICASLAMRLFNRREDANFIGQWVPTLLILGLYNKLVKQLGSD